MEGLEAKSQGRHRRMKTGRSDGITAYVVVGMRGVELAGWRRRIYSMRKPISIVRQKERNDVIPQPLNYSRSCQPVSTHSPSAILMPTLSLIATSLPNAYCLQKSSTNSPTPPG